MVPEPPMRLKRTRIFRSSKRHEAQRNGPVGGMAGGSLLVADEDHGFAVGGDVGRPVDVVVAGDLLGRAAIRMHAPDLHAAATVGIEIDVLAVGGAVRIVANAVASGERVFFAAIDGDGEDVAGAVIGAGKDDGFAVGRPAMPVGIGMLGDEARRAAGEGNDVDAGFGLAGRGATDGEQIGRRATGHGCRCTR